MTVGEMREFLDGLDSEMPVYTPDGLDIELHVVGGHLVVSDIEDGEFDDEDDEEDEGGFLG